MSRRSGWGWVVLAFLAALTAPVRFAWACADGTPCVPSVPGAWACPSAAAPGCDHGALPETSRGGARLEAPESCRFQVTLPPALAALLQPAFTGAAFSLELAPDGADEAAGAEPGPALRLGLGGEAPPGSPSASLRSSSSPRAPPRA